MGYNREDYIRIKAEFSQKYIKARESAQERRFELHARLPRVREIDTLLSRTGMDIMGVIASGKDTDEKIKKLKERNDALLLERGRVLRENGYPEDYSDSWISVRISRNMRRTAYTPNRLFTTWLMPSIA